MGRRKLGEPPPPPVRIVSITLEQDQVEEYESIRRALGLPMATTLSIAVRLATPGMMALCHTLFNASQHIQDAIDRATLSTISPEDKAFLDASLQAVAQRVAQRNTEKIAVLAAYEAKYAAQTHAPLPTLEQLHAEFKAVPETSLPIDVKKELAEAMTDAGIVPPPEPKPIPPEELDINTVI